MGLEAYRKQNAIALIGRVPEGIEGGRGEGSNNPLRLFDMDREGLPELVEDKPGFNFIGPEDWDE
jgi:hypothetical protein